MIAVPAISEISATIHHAQLPPDRKQTRMYEILIDQGCPLKWKNGQPPENRDAKREDIVFKGELIADDRGGLTHFTVRW